MNKTEVTLLVLVVALYFKWVVFAVLYPCQVLANIYWRHPNKFTRILYIPHAVFNRIGGGERYTMYILSTLPSIWIRVWLYRGIGVHIGRNVVMHYKTKIRSPHRLYIGDGSIIGDNVELDSRSGLVIGKNVNISSNVNIWTLQHDHRDPLFRCPDPTVKRMDVRVEDRVWLGSNVIILPGVTIGEGSVCCAGCVVTKDITPYTVVAGIPAKMVGKRPSNLQYEFKGEAGTWIF